MAFTCPVLLLSYSLQTGLALGIETLNRRELLAQITYAALAAGMLSPEWMASARAHGAGCGEKIDSADSLRHGLQRLALRDASEQSTPMLLSLENLAKAPDDAQYVPDAFNAEVTATYERYVNLLLQYKSDPDEGDVAALIELLAERDLFPFNRAGC